ncbi:MAG: DUF1617 family protein [Carnobacterium sp.]|uniref:DUF1617 family protein n=1 Tax=Carnobacterium sp. TaxID=48221 RepID=UPI003C747CE0
MKTIKLENQLLLPVFTFLQNVNLKANKASRGRTQLLKRLEEKSKEFNEALTEIRKEYFEISEDGELVVVDGKYEFKDKENKVTLEAELNDKVEELNKETFEIQFGEYSTKYDALFLALDNLEVEISGQEAFAYNELMDAYEVNEDKKEEEK